MIPGNMTPN